MARTLTRLFLCFLALAVPSSAYADLTAFIGVSPTPATRPVRGFAAGVTMLVVGVEFEYANSSEDAPELAPGLRTYTGNVLVQTPVALAGIHFYVTGGAGVYRENLFELSRTDLAVNVGGGIKMALVGPLRLRLDYRVFTLRGDPIHADPQRFYAGLNLRF